MIVPLKHFVLDSRVAILPNKREAQFVTHRWSMQPIITHSLFSSTEPISAVSDCSLETSEWNFDVSSNLHSDLRIRTIYNHLWTSTQNEQLDRDITNRILELETAMQELDDIDRYFTRLPTLPFIQEEKPQVFDRYVSSIGNLDVDLQELCSCVSLNEIFFHERWLLQLKLLNEHGQELTYNEFLLKGEERYSYRDFCAARDDLWILNAALDKVQEPIGR